MFEMAGLIVTFLGGLLIVIVGIMLLPLLIPVAILAGVVFLASLQPTPKTTVVDDDSEVTICRDHVREITDPREQERVYAWCLSDTGLTGFSGRGWTSRHPGMVAPLNPRPRWENPRPRPLTPEENKNATLGICAFLIVGFSLLYFGPRVPHPARLVGRGVGKLWTLS